MNHTKEGEAHQQHFWGQTLGSESDERGVFGGTVALYDIPMGVVLHQAGMHKNIVERRENAREVIRDRLKRC